MLSLGGCTYTGVTPFLPFTLGQTQCCGTEIVFKLFLPITIETRLCIHLEGKS